jgi:serine/threonine protein kinase
MIYYHPVNNHLMDTFPPNARIGVYRVIRLLGRGGMGAVYEVVHEKLGVHYALKTFTLDHGHVELLKERFLAEGRILARLHHPRLVRVFDLDVDSATQTIYFVMDLVLYKDGEPYTLADVEDGSVEEERLARWFGQLASALDYIHNAGIVHRDIKLGNILLDASGGVVLSDFGVSRFCSGQLRRDLQLERTVVSGEASTGALIMGTAGYMAPEVRRGEDATAASDAYSLGIVFFKLLTGVMFANRPNIWGLLEPFDGRWRQLLSRLLAESPNDRPILLEPFVRLLSPAETGTSPDAPTLVRGKMFRTRHLWVIPVVAAVVALAVAAVAVVFFARKPNASAAQAAAVQFASESESPARNDAASNEVNADDLFTIPVALDRR